MRFPAIVRAHQQTSSAFKRGLRKLRIHGNFPLKFLTDRSGNFATITAVAMVPILGTAGLAIDYAQLVQQRSDMQESADSAVLAAAGELFIANVQGISVQEIAESYVLSNYEVDDRKYTVRAQIGDAGDSVRVEFTNYWKPFILQYFGDHVTPIRVAAEARSVSNSQAALCLLALNGSESATINMTRNAKLIADNCVVHSNSSDAASINMATGATMVATSVCSSGGTSLWSPAAIIPTATTDCPPLQDPLRDRSEPTFGKCDFTRLHIVGKDMELEPGVYCQGIRISKGSKVKFNPGIYVINGGVLTATDTSSIEGKGVGFFMAGGSHFNFNLDSYVSLEAPTTGTMAGLLFFEDRAFGQTHTISSNNARHLTGTIYLANGTLQVDARKVIADLSAYTAIIANKVRVKDGPILHLNTDYKATDVPVPGSLLNGGGAGTKKVVLSR